MTKLSWEQLDACQTPDAIADLLRREGVRGVRTNPYHCPLARATGYVIYAGVARTRCFTGPAHWHQLTDSENQFVEDVNNGRYPDLIEETED